MFSARSRSQGPAWQNLRAARPKPCGVYGANEGGAGSRVPDLSVTWDYAEAVTLRRGRCHTRPAGLARDWLPSCILRRQRNQSGCARRIWRGQTTVRALFDVGCMPARSSAIPNREALYLSYRCSARDRAASHAMRGGGDGCGFVAEVWRGPNSRRKARRAWSDGSFGHSVGFGFRQSTYLPCPEGPRPVHAWHP